MYGLAYMLSFIAYGKIKWMWQHGRKVSCMQLTGIGFETNVAHKCSLIEQWYISINICTGEHQNVKTEQLQLDVTSQYRLKQRQLTATNENETWTIDVHVNWLLIAFWLQE